MDGRTDRYITLTARRRILNVTHQGAARETQDAVIVISMSTTGSLCGTIARALKMEDQKMQDLKMQDQMSAPENAGPAFSSVSSFLVPHFQVLHLQSTALWERQCRGSTSSTFGLVTISGCAPYAAVDVRRPSFTGRRLSSLEQSATSRHVCSVTVCIPQSSEDSCLQTQFSLNYIVVPMT